MKAARRTRVDRVLLAAREYTGALVGYHDVIAAWFEISTSDLKALDLLERSGPRCAGDIAKSTGLASASVTALIDRLEGKKLVRRAPDARDGRRVMVEPTEVLREYLLPLFDPISRRLRLQLEGLGPAELVTVETFLTRSGRDLRAATRSVRRGRRRPFPSRAPGRSGRGATSTTESRRPPATLGPRALQKSGPVADL
ncbi:MAG: MarR family winged helix-turn-helix transcriptional regulator [Thermoplasmata archaeon]